MRAATRTGRWILLAWLVGAPAGAQDTEPAPIFTETVTVEIVNLDVVVTDRKGEPVLGLTREDFELRVDGEPTAIENFYVVEPEPERGAAAAAPEEAAEARSTESREATEVPREQQLHLVVLVDGRHATQGERKRVMDELAATFAEGLGGRGRRVAVMEYDGGTKVRQPFTSDGAKIAAALSGLATGVAGYTADFERRNILREIEQVDLGSDTAATDAASALATIELYIEQQSGDLRRTLGSIQSLIDGLSGLPGRKALLYIASGMSTSPGRELLAAWRNKFGALQGIRGVSNLDLAGGRYDAVPDLRRLARRANASRVAFYAIGTAGAGPTSAVSAEEGGFDLGALETAGGGRTWDAALDATFRAEQGSGLELVAALTGGDALTGSSNYDGMAERIERDASHAYSLGFRPPESDSGSSHKVEVRVPAREVRLSYRREFVTKTPRQVAADRTLAALLWDVADNPIGLAVDLWPAQSSDEEDGKGLVQPMLVKVPFVNLVLVPQGRVHRGQLTIFVAAEDERGRISPVQTIEAPVRIPSDQMVEALQGVGGYRVGLQMRPGPSTIAVGVRDEIGNVVSTVRIDHDVRPVGGGGS